MIDPHRRHPLQVELVDLLLLGVCVLLGASGGNASFVVEGLTTTDGVLQVLDFTYERNIVRGELQTRRMEDQGYSL